MLLPRILFLYLTRNFLFYFFSTTGLLSICIFFVGIFDSINRLKNTVSISNIIYVSLLKLPYLISELLPLIMLIALIFLYENLSKKNEIVVLFSGGISVWKMLQPILFISFLLSIIGITVLQPFGAKNLNKQTNLEKKYSNQSNNKVIGLSDSGIYLFEQINDQKRVISASYIYVDEKKLENISILFFDINNNFKYRIEAKEAVLEDKVINFSSDAYKIMENGKAYHAIEDQVTTTLDLDTIIKRFESPETISFWSLQELSKNLTNSGINAERFINYYYKLLYRPIYGIAIILLATCFLSVNPRARYGIKSVGVGIIVGFIIHSSREIGAAYLTAHDISIFVSQLLPALIVMIASTIILINKFES